VYNRFATLEVAIMSASIGFRLIVVSFLAAITLTTIGCQPPTAPLTTNWSVLRIQMVEEQLAARGIENDRVLAVMGKVPRHEFVSESVRHSAYDDHPLPIGEGQTISQPYIVALMTELADSQPDHRILEVGTGSGYQAAVLAELVAEVYTIELLPGLAESAEARLNQLGYGDKVHVRAGDGYLGWPDAAPFDSILVTCGADHVPEPLFEQLKPGGKMIIPVGPRSNQVLRVIEKDTRGSQHSRDVVPVRFVPLRRADELSENRK
jgi:protein-L-isoaspartate(D-aspartate) O-methyltransferase